MTSFKLGFFAEYIMAILYFFKFYNILHHRYKSKVGEIDLVAVRGNNLVFIEVKARKKGMHEDIVSINQQDRISRTAEYFIVKNPIYKNYNIRFDLAVVRPYSWPVIIKNAW